MAILMMKYLGFVFSKWNLKFQVILFVFYSETRNSTLKLYCFILQWNLKFQVILFVFYNETRRNNLKFWSYFTMKLEISGNLLCILQWNQKKQLKIFCILEWNLKLFWYLETLKFQYLETVLLYFTVPWKFSVSWNCIYCFFFK